MKILRLFSRILRGIDNVSVEIFVGGIRLYQKTFSPDHGIVSVVSHVQRCRFFPTCSDYAIESLRQYRLARGTMLSLKRIARCNPFCAGGYDPVVIK